MEQITGQPAFSEMSIELYKYKYKIRKKEQNAHLKGWARKCRFQALELLRCYRQLTHWSTFHVIVCLDSFHWTGTGETLIYLPVLSSSSQGFPASFLYRMPPVPGQTVAVIVPCRGEPRKVSTRPPHFKPPSSPPFLRFSQQPECALDNVENFLAYHM